VALNNKHIALAHGNGGRYMRELIDDLFGSRLANPHLDTSLDAAVMPLTGDLLVTTDGFTVQPLEFPGGNIGSLAIHGTVNDLAVSGATPRFLTLNAFLEDGMEMALLTRLVDAMAAAARDCGVSIIAGDTKVVGRGECGGVYLATTGVGIRDPRAQLGFSRIRPDDNIIISGSVGAHGAAVMLAREEFGMHGDLQSDAASLLPVTQTLLAYPGLRFMRDPTRGGVATVLHEIARCTGMGIEIRESQLPVNDSVAAVCELLGFDPLYLACEGRLVGVIDPADTEAALDELRRSGVAPDARVIGRMVDGGGDVVLETELGGQRILDELEDDPLPRIC